MDQTPETDSIKLSITDAASALEVVPRTVYSKIKKHGWRQEHDLEGRSYVWVPKQNIKNPRFMDRPTPVHTQITHHGDLGSTQDRSQYDAMVNSKDETIASLEKTIALLEEQTALLKEQNTTLNNELGTHKHQIQRYKSQEQTLDDIRAMVAQLQKERASYEKPWWRFWQ